MPAITNIESPFKFLRPYEKRDTEIFFGRDDAAKELYQYITKNRLVLVYGPPDCGKTSLIQCGLAKWFSATDWMPFYIRRCGNINHALFRALNDSEALRQNAAQTDISSERIVEALSLIEKRCLRPVYLFFDGFEETLVRATEDELKTFIDILQNIHSASTTQSCHMVFVLRGGHLDRLRPFEKAIPGFSERKIPVQPLLEPEIASIIQQSCKHFNITLTHPEEQVELIMQALADEPGLSLSYLQVYLDRLWKEDYVRTYPEGGTATTAPLEVTSEEIKSLGNIRKVVSHFLIERATFIQNAIKEAFPEASADTVKNAVDAFVSPQGVGVAVPYKESGDLLQLPASAPRYLRELPPQLFSTIVHQLEASRILRLNGYSMELTNDLLADLVYLARPRERKRRDEMERMIIGQYEAFSTTGQYLTGRQVRMYEAFLPQLNLEEKHIEFFRKSKARRRTFGVLKIVGFLVLPLLFFLVYGFFRFAYEADKAYALLYLDQTVDTIKNKGHAVRLARNIYDRKKTTAYSDVLARSLLTLFQSQPIQGKFSDYNQPLSSTSVSKEDVDISGNGAFVLLSDSLAYGARYKLFNREGLLDTLFTGIYKKSELVYAYFIDHSDFILLAYKTLKGGDADNLYPHLKAYPDSFQVWDCRKRQYSWHVSIPDGFLLPREDVFWKQSSEYDSYRVRFTRSGYLLVPLFLQKGGNSLLPQLRAYRDTQILYNRTSSSSVSVSGDKERFSVGYSRGRLPVVELYDEAGVPQGSMNDIYFADFTAQGSMVYIRKGVVVIRSRGGDTSRRYDVNPQVNYAWAGGPAEKFILTRSQDSLFYIHAAAPAGIGRLREKLVGASFQHGFFVTSEPADPAARKAKGITFRTRSFTGTVMHTRFIAGSIRDYRYNEQASSLLLLTDSNKLLLLDKGLHLKASFQLTPNDVFGFCKDGTRFFYVRDNWLSVFSNNDQLIDLSDFGAVYSWIDRQEGDRKGGRGGNKDSSFSQPIKELRKQYDLRWPSRHIL